MDTSITAIVFSVTIVVSIIIALLLAKLASSTGKPENKPVEATEEQEKYQVSDGGELKQAIYREVSEVVESRMARQEISERVYSIFSKEIENQIHKNTEALEKKYKLTIEEKSLSEDTAWKRYKEVLAESRETKVVMESIAEGLVVVDPHGDVVMMNPAAEKILGVSKKDKMGKPVIENLGREQLVSFIKDSPGSEDKEIEMVSKDNETKKIIRSSNARIEDKNGRTVGIVSVLSDITKQRALDHMKDMFLSNVTHELRSPIIAAGKALSIMRKQGGSRIPADGDDFFTMAENNIRKLGVLVDDLLDLSKMEGGKMELKKSSVSIGSVIETAVNNLDTWAKTKSIAVEKEIEKNIPKVNVDPLRIDQVLTNLIGNAIKFTPESGKIRIITSMDKENNELKITVEDNGTGIGKDDLPKIFDRFYQGEGRTPTDIQGTGIGLSIAKEIVEAHGGRIWAESEENRGARFTFTLKA